MTTTHQLMAAAFYLCGLLFLLHVDSVNSRRCKYCLDTGEDCRLGNVPDIECLPNHNCALYRRFNPGMVEHQIVLRTCTDEHAGEGCRVHPSSRTECWLACDTDSCNNAVDIGEELHGRKRR